jgi:hypothetical protein
MVISAVRNETNCLMVDYNSRFEEMCCLHLQGKKVVSSDRGLFLRWGTR